MGSSASERHSKLLERAELCSDSVHPAAVWYREDIPRLLEQLETAQRERDTLDSAIADYAEATGMLIHSWPDDERERQRQSLYADTKFMQSALDAQADSIAALKRERDWWRQRYMLDEKPDAGQVARLDYEAAEFADSSPASKPDVLGDSDNRLTRQFAKDVDPASSPVVTPEAPGDSS